MILSNSYFQGREEEKFDAAILFFKRKELNEQEKNKVKTFEATVCAY